MRLRVPAALVLWCLLASVVLLAAETLDPFTTDPAGRWTAVAGSATHDAGNGEYDLDISTNTHLRNGTDLGNVEHESQVTWLAIGSRTPGPAVRFSTSANDHYDISYNGANSIVLNRWIAGARTELTTFAPTVGNTDFLTVRMSASGTVGNNVVLNVWFSNHSTSKPGDPGWIGVDGSPDFTYTDTESLRLDDSVHTSAGIAGRNIGVDSDTRHDYYKQRLISDRGGAPSTGYTRLTLLGVGGE